MEGSGQAFNTVPPSDFGFFELMNEVVQDVPAGSTSAELMGQLAAIGIVKGQPFEPDERMRGSSTTRPPSATPPRGHWSSPREHRKSGRTTRAPHGSTCCGLAVTRRDAAAARHKEGIKPFPATGVRKQHSRTAFLYAATGDHTSDVHAPHRHRVAIPHRSQGRRRKPLRRRADLYQMTLPPDIPAARFWSLTALRQRDALDAPDTAALPARREPVVSDTRRRPRTPTVRRPSRSAPTGQTTLRRATGSRRRRARAGSCSCASTARSQPFFDKSWQVERGRARVGRSVDLDTATSPTKIDADADELAKQLRAANVGLRSYKRRIAASVGASHAAPPEAARPG